MMKIMTTLPMILLVAGVMAGQYAAAAEKGAPASKNVFEMVLVLDKPEAGSERVNYPRTIDGKVINEVLHVRRVPQLNEKELSSVVFADDPPRVVMKFNPRGTQKLAEVSRHHLHKRMAILVRGKVITAPVIRMEISGGHFEINGLMFDEAREIASEIRSAMPAR